MDRIEYRDGKLLLAPSRDGLLRIWEHPEEGVEYFMGVDAAEGVRGQDWSVAEVIRGDTCAQVAEYRGHVEPTEWGKMAARLGWYFNEAYAAVEAYPSAHGLVTAMAMRAYGYHRLHYRTVVDQLTKKQTEKLGWSTDSTSHPRMLARIRLALANGVPIRSEVLLREFLNIRFAQSKEVKEAGKTNWKAVCRGHDDAHDAYAIALCVRDERYVAPRGPKERTPEPRTLQEIAWARARERNRAEEAPRRVYDGY